MRIHWFIYKALMALAGLGLSQAIHAQTPALATPDKMSWLDNGKVRLGVDLSLGGAVTFLSGPSSHENMINSFDWGRQIQLSFYSGPNPFAPPGIELNQAWSGLGWNPIQSGDSYGNRSKVIETRNDGETLYVKSTPMIWPLKNYPGECTFECWFRLKDNTVEVTSQLNNARPGLTLYLAHNQELPAVYTNGPWYKLVSYLGDKPFMSAPATTVVDRNDGKGWPWLSYFSTENWSALLNQDDVGLGIFEPGTFHFSGGFAGAPKGSGGEKASQAGYMAPNALQILDNNIVYKFHYVLIAGSLTEIRAYVNSHHPPMTAPDWHFTSDRQGWTYENATDAGWPIQGELAVQPDKKSAALDSPAVFWQAADAPTLYIEAAFQGQAETSAVMFQRYNALSVQGSPAWGDGPKAPPAPWTTPMGISAQGDGQYHTYRVDLTHVADYTGPMTAVKLLLPSTVTRMRIKSIGFVPPGG